ncbi:MAG: hypothetical protein H6581_30745 [Bacteroidia bacterium]|nr:hypothetical protein [Bacteroidia bacterium]
MDLYQATDPATKNRYYRLRNKLLDNIEKSLVFYHFKYKDSIHAYYDVQLAIMFKERGQHELSRYFLKKAEKKAEALDQFHILEIIYGEYVQLAMKNIDLDIEEIIQKREENLHKIAILRRNTEAIAIIKQKLKKSRFSKSRGSVLEMLDELKSQIEKTADIFNSTEGKILIFQTVSTILHNKAAYSHLTEYLYETIGEFEKNNLFSKANHSMRLLMRLRLIISLYKTYHLPEALEQLAIFEEEMVMYHRQYYHTYLFNYFNIKIYSQKTLGQSRESLETIHHALSIPEIKNHPLNANIIRISLAGEFFNLGEFEKALQEIQQIQASDGYELMEPQFQMHLDIFKMVLHYELKMYQENLDAQKKFRKDHKRLLKLDETAKTSRFVEILLRMSDGALEGRRISLRSAYRNFEESFDMQKEDEGEIINPHLFLKSHLEGQSYYKLFLELMSGRIEYVH